MNHEKRILLTGATGYVGGRLIPLLEAKGVPADSINTFFSCLDACDRQRFAPSGADAEEMNAFVGRAEEAMSQLDGSLSA